MPESKSTGEMVRKQSHRQKWLLGGIAALITAGGIYWVLSQRFASRTFQTGAEFLPTQTIGTFTFSTDRSQWQQLRQLGTPASRAVLEQVLSKGQQEIFTANGFDFERQIQPWVGSDVTVAYLAPPSTATEPLPVVLLPINAASSPPQVQQQLQNFANAPLPVKKRNYQGHQIMEATINNKNVVYALVDRWVIASTMVQAVEQSIDAFQSKNNLTQSPGFAQAIGDIATAQSGAQIYLNIPLFTASKAGSGALAPEQLAQVQQQQGFAANISINGDLLTAKGVAWWKSDGTVKLSVSKNSPSVATMVPDQTLLMISGSNLAQLWQDYLPLAANNPLAPFQPTAVSTSFKSATGLDLNNDVLAWSNDEFGLALIPSASAAKSSVGGSLLLMVKSSDQQATETTFATLDKTMASRYQYQVTKNEIQGKEVINWSSPISEVNASRGWLADRWAFLALGAPVAEQLLPQPPATLANNREFQRVMSGAIAPHSGQFYINLENLNKSNSLVLRQLPPTTQAILGAVQSIGITSQVASPTTNRFDLVVSIKQLAGQAPAQPSPSIPSTKAP